MKLQDIQAIYPKILQYFKNNYPKAPVYSSEITISAGGAAVVLGIKKTTRDIDLNIAYDLWMRLDNLPTKVISSKCGYKRIEYKRIHLIENKQLFRIDIHCAEMVNAQRVHGVWIPDITYLIEERKRLGRAKDLPILKKLITLVGE